MTHSKIGASSMYRWKACPGSVKLSEGIESTPSKYAEEGTKAHELAAKMLTGDWPHIISEEMADYLKIYVNEVYRDAGTNKFLVEHKFDLTEVFPGLYGTADAVFYDPKTKVLYVYDLKYGQGILVAAENNPQLMYYGLGALLSTKSPCKEVELVIVQPRADHANGPVRRWRTSALNMVEFAADLYDYALATTKKDAPLNPGDHCRFCPAIGICPSLRNKSLQIAQTEFSPTLSYDPKVLSETLKKVDMLEDYAKGVRAFAYSEAEHGRVPPGWKLVQKRATRKWNRPEDEMRGELQKRFGLKPNEILDPPTLKSVAQIEKLFSKERKPELNKLVSAVSSGLALVEDSDPRPPALAGAETEFSKIL